jgi:hypothetical protein
VGASQQSVEDETMVGRFWIFTWRTYGTWLPGEEGFVGAYRTNEGMRVNENSVGTETVSPMPGLVRYAEGLLNHPPVLLSESQAEVVEREMLRTCAYRHWIPDALAVIPNHVYIMFGVPDDPDPTRCSPR